MNAGGVDSLGRGHVGQDSGEAACQLRWTRLWVAQQQEDVTRTPPSTGVLDPPMHGTAMAVVAQQPTSREPNMARALDYWGQRSGASHVTINATRTVRGVPTQTKSVNRYPPGP
jgi:hypothetical protein